MAIQIRRGTDAQWESNKSNIVVGEPAIATDTERVFVGTGSGTYTELANASAVAQEYNTATSYVVGDIVLYKGQLKRCNTPTSGAWVSANWDDVTLAEAIEALSEDGAIGTDNLADGAVTTAKIADRAITSDKLGNYSVYSEKIFDTAVTASKLATNSVITEKIKDGAVTTAKLADSAVTTAKITDGAVTEDKLAANAVTSGKIKDGAIATADLANNAVTGEKLATNSVGNGHLENNSISTIKIQAKAVTKSRLADAVTEQIDGNTQGISDLNDALAKKADKNGDYDDLTSGSAKQLLSEKGITDTEPFVFRKSISGDREEMTLQGISLNWNQLIEPLSGAPSTVNGVTVTPNANGSVTLNGTSTSSGVLRTFNHFQQIVGHKYFLSVVGSVDYNGFTEIGGGTTYSATIRNAIVTGTTSISIRSANNITYNNNVMWFIAIDLTALFGSAEIADHVYALEQATVGAGVTWFRRYFKKVYYEYCMNKIIHMKFSQFQTIGFNQWDEEWEVGTINSSTGENQTYDQRIRSKNYIPVVPNTTYYFNAPSSYSSIRVAVYDAGHNYLGLNEEGWLTVANNSTFSVGAKVGFIRFCAVKSDSTYNHDICINFHYDGERDGEYEPYEVNTYALDNSIDLMGIAGLDSAGNLCSKIGDIYPYTGSGTRKMGIVDLGTLDWTYNTSSAVPFFWSSISDMPLKANMICEKYVKTIMLPNNANYPDRGISNYNHFANAHNILIRDDAYTTAASFKQAMSGVYLVYEKEEYIDFTAEPFAENMVVDNWGTELFTVPTQSGVEIPIGHSTFYPDNLRKKIEDLPWNFNTLIAITEDTATATRNYAVGDYLILDNQLYKVTSAIANGGTIAVGTNVVATTIMSEIKALA